MNCLVIKLPSSATDNTLRRLDEFRFRAKVAGNGSGYSKITFVVKANSANLAPKLKIVSGNGSISETQGGDEVQELVFSNNGTAVLEANAFLKCSTNCVIGIENCKSVIEIGHYTPGTAYGVLFNRLSSVDSPIISMNISELRLFKHCACLFVNQTGQVTDYTGDISVLKDFEANRIWLTGAPLKKSPVTGDIAVFDTPKADLRITYTNVYGSIPDSFSSLYFLMCSGAKVEGDLNKLSANLTALYHSNSLYHADSVFKFDFSAPQPKPSELNLYDSIGGQLLGEFSDVLVTARTSGVNISCQSVNAPVNVDLYEVIRRLSNKTVTNFSGIFTEGSTYTFSGSIASVINSSGIGIFEHYSNNIPDENAIAILDHINRSTVNANLTKRISLRCNSANGQITTLVGQLQAKGYIVNIYALK